jgi:Ca2+-binding RTX toxin-like protein
MLVNQLAATLALSISLCPGPIEGTAGDDRLHGTRHDDVIYGYRGDDRIRAGRGSDVLDGGRGDDVLRAYVGGQGRPIDPGNDVFRGGPGRDRLYVSHGDRVRAGPGNDHVWAYYLDEDTDFIDCGAGFDVLHLHQNLHDLSTVGCEEWDVQIAG